MNFRPKLIQSPKLTLNRDCLSMWHAIQKIRSPVPWLCRYSRIMHSFIFMWSRGHMKLLKTKDIFTFKLNYSSKDSAQFTKKFLWFVLHVVNFTILRRFFIFVNSSALVHQCFIYLVLAIHIPIQWFLSVKLSYL